MEGQVGPAALRVYLTHGVYFNEKWPENSSFCDPPAGIV
jgi:hypothetical protein